MSYESDMTTFPFNYSSHGCPSLFARFRTAKSNWFAIQFIVLLVTLLSFDNSEAEEFSDPFMEVNRVVHGFNSLVDTVILSPLAKTYDRGMPKVVKRGFSNAIANVGDVVVTLNDLLQLKFVQAGSDFSRVAINSTLGVGGLVDVAGGVFDLEKHDEDFGQTLAHWGINRGPYLVLPLLGPNTIREGAALGVDSLFNPALGSRQGTVRNSYTVLKSIDARAELQTVDELIIGDEYLFIRDAYLQNLTYREAEGELQVVFEDF